MARTEIDKYQILNRQLTGSDLNNLIGVYDETQNYNIGEEVFWKASKYRCTVTVTGGSEGVLDNAPHIDTTHWVELGSTGISVEDHRLIDQLVHNIAENSYCEIIKTANKVSSIVIWTSDSKTLKIREFTITRDLNGKVATVATKQYDASGVLVATFTETFNRTSGKVTSITGVLS